MLAASTPAPIGGGFQRTVGRQASSASLLAPGAAPGGFATSPAMPQTPRQVASHGSGFTPGGPGAAAGAAITPEHRQPAAVAAADTSLSPRELGKRVINDFLARDGRYPDLDRILQQSQLGEYNFAPNPADLGPWRPFTRSRIVNIPDTIFEQYNQTDLYTKMGLFPEIQRAWITVDNRVYFWNYMDGSGFHSFEDLPHTILAMHLVRPKPGTFIDTITHLLLLATPLEFHIIGVSATPDLQLYETGMVVPIRGFDIGTIAGSDKSGRIFFSSGDQADVWEVTYSNTEGWFKSKCGKVCHTKGGLSGYSPSLAPITSMIPFSGSSLLSSILPASHKESIVSMIVDDDRLLLYTLSSLSTIRAYHMSSPTELKLVITYTYATMCSNIQMINLTSPLIDPRTTSIVSIHAVKPRESSQIHVVATTSTGCRLYIRAARTYGFGLTSSESNPPTTMQVIQVRFPPADPAQPPPPTVPGGPMLSTRNRTSALKTTAWSRIFSPGYFFCVTSGKPSDSLFVAAPDAGRILQQSTHVAASAGPLFENATFVEIEGYIQAIAELTPEFKVTNRPEGHGNEVCGQYMMAAPAEFAVLTNTGVHMYTRKYLFETFAGMCDTPSSLRVFADLYGRGEMCATALAVACSTSMFSSDVRETARRVYLEAGGHAQVQEDVVSYPGVAPGGAGAGGAGLGLLSPPGTGALSLVGSLSEKVKLSGRHDGLGMYLSRIMRPIWTSPILQVKQAKGKPVYAASFSEETLARLGRLLYEVHEFLVQNQSFIEGMGGERGVLGIGPRNEEIALQAEHRSLYALFSLIGFMREGLSFVSMITEEPRKLNEIIGALLPDMQARVARLTFEGLFTSGEGTDLAKELVNAIVNQSMASGGSVDTVADALRKRCGTFCSADDVIIFKAVEFLKRAKAVAVTDVELKNQFLRESVRLLIRTAHTIQLENLKEAVQELMALDFHTGAIEVVLKAAAESDRANLALAYVFDGRPEGDYRAPLYEKRAQCYSLIFAVLDDIDARCAAEDSTAPAAELAAPGSMSRTKTLRQETYAVAYGSTDELFHYSFYDWFVQRGLAERLLDVHTAYIEAYLERNSKTSLPHADLFWLFLAKRENFLVAAQVLYTLAIGDFDLALSQRIEYLSRARGFCNCYCPPSSRQQMLILVQNVQAQLEVSAIQDDILTRVRSDKNLAEDKRAQLVDQLDGKILDVSTLYNHFASALGYHAICLEIFRVAEYTNAEDIERCRQQAAQENVEI
ncbi:Non-repetitive/WGA-negative nucleoporin C-terminal-domain-containing protein [Dipodascopsis tothii]|uniref:Non-repetitive/WGA-negative nucleoporin C-terminal-domain-containing protein n=1 Tax=Dipodascopsis tothii TaxID=44089 RepID=UPI0034CDD2E8